MGCFYQCINGRGVLLFDSCPGHNCDSDGGECFAPNTVYQTLCPLPFGKVEVDEDAVEL